MSDDDMDSSESAVSEPEPIDTKPPLHTMKGAKRGKKDLLTDASGNALPGALTLGAGSALQYQSQNGLLGVLPSSGHNVDFSSLAGLTPGTVIMTQDGQQFLIPVSMNGDQLSVGLGGVASGSKHGGSAMSGGSSAGSPGSSSMGLANMGHSGNGDEATRKREVRLLKNREAAKECRRKKKEYIKCLENRVAVLENQNKALIEELKSLKELYCKSTAHD